MTELQHPKNSPFIAHWLIFGIAASLLGSFLFWNIYQGYSETGSLERERLSMRARIVDENMVRQLDSVNRMLEGFRNDLARWEEQEDGMHRASARMAAMADVMPGVRFIAMLDARGKITATSQKEFIGQDFRHRNYFLAPQRNPDPDTLYVSAPFRNVSGIITMGLSRAIVAPDGRFVGVVMASLEPEEFRILMNSVRYAPDMQAYLMHGDGMVFMAIPEQEGLVGMDMAAKPDSFFKRHIGSGQVASVISGMIPATEEERMMALRTSRIATLRMSKPMVIAISRDLSAIFAVWRREAWLHVGVFGVLLLISGAGLFAYHQRLRNYSQLVAGHESEQQEAAERLKLATEAANMGVWEYDLVNGTLIWGDSMFAIYGVKPEKFSASYEEWRNSLLPEDVAAVDAALGPALEEGKPFDICFRIRRGDGQVRTIRALAQAHFDESGKAVRMVGINEDITERKGVEDLLRFHSETLLNLSEGVLLTRTDDGIIVFANPRFEQMFGYGSGEILGNHVSVVNAPGESSPEKVATRIMSDLARTGKWRGEVQNIRKDGTTFWCHASVLTFDHPQFGRVWIAVHEDITERKQAEQALAESESRFREIFNTVSDAIFIHDAETGRIIDINRRMCEMYGFTREEALVCGPDDLSAGTPPYSSAEAAEKIYRARADGPQTFEWLARAHDGHFFWVEVSLRLATIGGSQRILATVRDISDRKQVENALRESESRYRLLVESSPFCIHEIDLEGCLLSMNSAGLDMLGLDDAGKIRGMPYLDTVNPQDAGRIGALLRGAIEGGSTIHFEFAATGKMRQHFKSCFIPITGSDGKVLKLMGITEDITERKQAEEQIRSLAFYDALTHLPNRRLLHDRLMQAMAASKRNGLYGALMFLDLDNFKPLNDMHGHDVGDLLLVEAAHRIASCVREMDTVARFGGDEFVVMLSELDGGNAESAKQANIVAEKIRATLAEPYMLKFRQEGNTEATIEHYCTASIGVVLFIDHEASPEDTLKWADIAMYRAKEGGRNRVSFYGA